MTVHQTEEQIRPLDYFNSCRLPIEKRTTMGVVIDCTGIYENRNFNEPTLRMRIIDPTLNPTLLNCKEPCTKMTVFFSYNDPNKIPNLIQLGDILYIKRFKIDKKYGELHAYSKKYDYCQWSLFGCQDGNGLLPYETSRKDWEFKQIERRRLKDALPQMRKFSRSFLRQQQLLTLVPAYQKQREKDYIVRVVQKNQNGFVVNDGMEDILVPGIRSTAPKDSIAKLRSIKELVNKKATISYYSSLIPVSKYSKDFKYFQKLNKIRREIPDRFYTLAQIMSMKPEQSHKLQFKVKVEVCNVSPGIFKESIKFFSSKQAILEDYDVQKAIQTDKSKLFECVYDVTLVCIDFQPSNIKEDTQLFEIRLFSSGYACDDFVPRIKLEDLNIYTTFVHEQHLYKNRIEQLQNATSVDLLVEVRCHYNNKEQRIILLKKIIKLNKQ